jgi:hypothetical protein
MAANDTPYNWGCLMSDINKSCSKHAEKILDTLQVEGSLSEKKILKITGLSQHEFYCGIGWLARENKIRQDKDTFYIDETNLTPTIGKNAGKIWLALDIWGEVDFLSLKRLAQVKDTDVLSALGWLACEDKIDGAWPPNTDETTKFWLKNP